MPAQPLDGSEVYGDFVASELERQVTRKASFEQRALSVITTSGALVTLLLGLVALSAKQQAFVLPGASKVLLLVALGAFVLAISGALAINVPQVYRNVTPDGLHNAVENRWTDSPSTARRTVARTQITAIRSARKVNGVKGIVLFVAIAFELLAVSLVAAAMGVVIYEPTLAKERLQGTGMAIELGLTKKDRQALMSLSARLRSSINPANRNESRLIDSILSGVPGAVANLAGIALGQADPVEKALGALLDGALRGGISTNINNTTNIEHQQTIPRQETVEHQQIIEHQQNVAHQQNTVWGLRINVGPDCHDRSRLGHCVDRHSDSKRHEDN